MRLYWPDSGLFFSLPVFIMEALIVRLASKSRLANRNSCHHRQRPHMNTCRQIVILLLGVVLLATAGCEKKKPRLPVQATAPAEPIPTPLPPEITEESPPKPAPAPPKETAKAEEPKPQPPKHHRRKPPQTPAVTGPTETSPAPSGNNTVAMSHPPANPAIEAPPDTAIGADITSAQLLQQKQTTTQLLEATEKTLSGLPHNLSHDDEQMVTQIRSYLAQSRKATTDGDFERAFNLATKAHLLSDALVKK
jgi:outer membrane biosynthesis protein TonB